MFGEGETCRTSTQDKQVGVRDRLSHGMLLSMSSVFDFSEFTIVSRVVVEAVCVVVMGRYQERSSLREEEIGTVMAFGLAQRIYLSGTRRRRSQIPEHNTTSKMSKS